MLPLPEQTQLLVCVNLGGASILFHKLQKRAFPGLYYRYTIAMSLWQPVMVIRPEAAIVELQLKFSKRNSSTCWIACYAITFINGTLGDHLKNTDQIQGHITPQYSQLTTILVLEIEIFSCGNRWQLHQRQ